MVAGACLAALSLAVGTAMADPSGTRLVNGTGSDTTQDVLNGYANGYSLAPGFPGFPGIKDGSGNLIVGSFNATGSSPISPKAGCSFARPAGSGPGVDALVAHTTDGCLQFARSSSDDSQTSARTGKNLTYIPFAVDALAVVTRTGSPVSKAVSIATLKKYYNCDPTLTFPGIANGVRPVLPHFGSGTRKFFLTQLGFTGTDADGADFVTRSNHTCVRDVSLVFKDPTTGAFLGVEENDGRELPSKDNSTPPKVLSTEIAPYSIAKWISQVNSIAGVQDVHGATLLRDVEAIGPLQLNTDSTLKRDVYNVVPNNGPASGNPPTTIDPNGVFTGSSSQVCQHPEVVKTFGFGVNANCGDTHLFTP